MSIRKMNRTALLLALTIVFQSLRLVLPMPAFISVYIIGSLVNACLLLAAATGGWRSSLALSVVAPVVAYLQQVLPVPALVLPVAAANFAYASGYLALAAQSRGLAVAAATAAKFFVIYLTVEGLIQYIGVPANLTAMLTMMLGWPQLITGFGGGAIFFAVRRRLFDATLG